MSNIDKQALRERYSAKPTPKCDICGAQMTIQRISGSRVTYGCSGAIYDETGCHYADGRSLADDHYEQSRVTVTDDSDSDVLALLDELEAKDKLNAELLEKQRLLDICQGQGLEHRIAAEKRAEAEEKRVAELECITGALRELRSGHITIAGEKIGIYMREEVDAALGTAGIAKGE